MKPSALRVANRHLTAARYPGPPDSWYDPPEPDYYEEAAEEEAHEQLGVMDEVIADLKKTKWVVEIDDDRSDMTSKMELFSRGRRLPQVKASRYIGLFVQASGRDFQIEFMGDFEAGADEDPDGISSYHNTRFEVLISDLDTGAQVKQEADLDRYDDISALIIKTIQAYIGPLNKLIKSGWSIMAAAGGKGFATIHKFRDVVKKQSLPKTDDSDVLFKEVKKGKVSMYLYFLPLSGIMVAVPASYSSTEFSAKARANERNADSVGAKLVDQIADQIAG